MRPHPIPYPVFIPQRAASNPVARARGILILPGTVLLLLGGVLGRRCARSVCGVACTVSWASWLLFTGVLAPCVVLRVRRPGPPGSCSPSCTPCVRCCGCGVLGRLIPVHRRARSLCVVACVVSWAAWLLFTGVPDCVLCSVYGCKSSCHSCPALHRRTGPLAPRDNHSLAQGHWFAVSCAVSCVRCPGPLGSGSPVCTRCVRCCMCGVLGLLAPVHRCACSLCAPCMLPIPLPPPRLFSCMLSLTALLLFPAAAFSSSWRPWRVHSSLRLC